MRYLLTMTAVLIISGAAPAEIRIRPAEHRSNRPLRAHRAKDYQRYSQPRRYDALPSGWTRPRPSALRLQRRLAHQRWRQILWDDRQLAQQ